MSPAYTSAPSTSFATYRQLIAGSLETFDALAAELSGQLPGDHARQITATLATSLNDLGSQAWQLLRLAAQLAAGGHPQRPHRRRVRPPHERGGHARTRCRASGTPTGPCTTLTVTACGASTPARATWTCTCWSARPRPSSTPTPASSRPPEPPRSPRSRLRWPPQPTISAGIPRSPWKPSTPGTSRRPSRTPISPPTLWTCSTWLGLYDYGAGRYASARDLQQRTYDTLRRILGEDHPDTLTSANNLAENLRDLGDLAGARDLHQRIYDTRRRVLGEEPSRHPDQRQ